MATRKGGEGDASAADELSFEHLQSAAVEQPCQRSGVVRRDRTGCSILSAGE